MAVTAANWIHVELSQGLYLYKITEKIGEGGFAYVYRACRRHVASGDVGEDEVVVKVPKQHIQDDPDFAKRFQFEMQLMRKFSHSHIVKILDAGKHDGIPFAVMKFCRGGSLDNWREKRTDNTHEPIRPELLRDRLSTICDALDYVHRQGYVHRDVKPGNILFDEEDRVYLSDFGIAKALAGRHESQRSTEWTDPGMFVGTPEYAAPEVISPNIIGGKDFDGRADQYSVAAAVFDLLAGRPPFVGQDFIGLLLEIISDPAPLLHEEEPSVSKLISAVVNKGLSKHPDDRYANCASFCEALMSAIDGREPIQVEGDTATISSPAADRKLPDTLIEPPLPIEPKPRGSARNALAYAISVGLIVLLLGVGWGILEAARESARELASKLVEIPDQKVKEGAELQVPVSVNDKSLFAEAPTFCLKDPPDGCDIDETTGVITWTPDESQRPGEYDITVKASFAAHSDLDNEQAFRVTVEPQFKQASRLVAIGNQTVNEGTTLRVSARVNNRRLFTVAPSFSLKDQPADCTIEGTTGEITWKPNESQGPGEYVIRVNSTFASQPEFDDELIFQVTVREVNTLPEIAQDEVYRLERQELAFGVPWSDRLQATDEDDPKNTLTYELVSGPKGLDVESDGRLVWKQPDKSGSVTVRVSDDGTPSLRAVVAFSLKVPDARFGALADVLPDFADGVVIYEIIPGTPAEGFIERVLAEVGLQGSGLQDGRVMIEILQLGKKTTTSKLGYDTAVRASARDTTVKYRIHAKDVSNRIRPAQVRLAY